MIVKLSKFFLRVRIRFCYKGLVFGITVQYQSGFRGSNNDRPTDEKKGGGETCAFFLRQ